MATNLTLGTSTPVFRELMGNGRSYTVPKFQRNYSWGREEWEDLWADIVGMLEPGGEKQHYMGYLVLQSDDGKRFDIIDGQQRITTLTVLVLAAIKTLDDYVAAGRDAVNNAQRSQQFRGTYIGTLDPVSLRADAKLTLNRIDNGYFKQYLIPLKPKPTKSHKASEKLLRDGFEWFCRKVAEFADAADPTEPGRGVASLVQAAADNLVFTVITVSDRLNAYRVFETLNARGVKLSATDLLKNYLFSILAKADVPEEELDDLDDRWAELLARLEGDSFPDFLRVAWNSRHTMVRASVLFKEISKTVTDRAGVFALVGELEQDAENYVRLTQSQFWTAEEKLPLENSLATLELFGATQPYVVLLAVRRMPGLKDDDFRKVLRACAVLYFRYNVIGSLSPSELETAFNKAAVAVSRGDVKRASAAVQYFAPVYPTDSQFKAAFEEKSFTTRGRNRAKQLCYILQCLESSLTDGSEVGLDGRDTVEHILPQNPSGEWPGFKPAQFEAYATRLGNLTLLEAAINKDLGAAGFEAKRTAYADSQYALTRQVAANNDEWTPAEIDLRQKWMAEKAAQIWRLEQLS